MPDALPFRLKRYKSRKCRIISSPLRQWFEIDMDNEFPSTSFFPNLEIPVAYVASTVWNSRWVVRSLYDIMCNIFPTLQSLNRQR